MACPEGVDTEQALVDAWSERQAGASSAEHLELFDTDGGRLARFERRLMP